MMQWYVFLSLLLLKYCSAHEAWTDPNNPIVGGRRELTDENSSRTTTSKGNNELLMIVRQLMRDLDINMNDSGYIKKQILLQISPHSMNILSNYLNSQEKEIVTEFEQIRSSLSGIFSVLQEESVDWNPFIDYLNKIFLGLNILSFIFALFVIIKLSIRPKYILYFLFYSILFSSIYLTYNRKYKEAEAKRIEAHMSRGIKVDEQCEPEGLLSLMYGSVSNLFRFKPKSDCLKFIESNTIDILYEISIIEVVSETISSGLFSLISGSGKHINKFFRELYEDAPIIGQIVMTCFLLLMVGTVRSPFFSYDPILLTFGRDTIGKICAWLDDSKQEENRALTNDDLRNELEMITQNLLKLKLSSNQLNVDEALKKIKDSIEENEEKILPIEAKKEVKCEEIEENESIG